MRHFKIFFVIFIFLTIGHTECSAQENGAHFIKVLDPKILGIPSQCLGGVQDHRGIVYFSAGDKVVEYDGNRVRTLSLLNNAEPSALCVDSSGIVYVGGDSELGYLFPNDQGEMRYFSLMDRIDPLQRDFGSVWTCIAIGNTVYFSCDKGILIWNRIKMNFVETNLRYSIFEFNGSILLNNAEHGLCELKHGLTIPLKNGNYFLGKSIVESVQMNDQEILLVTIETGLTSYNILTGEINGLEHGVMKDFAKLKSQHVYSISRTYDGHLAIGTINSGVYLYSPLGFYERNINVSNGLLNNTINKLFNDVHGNLWICTDNGIVLLEIGNGLQAWTAKDGLNGKVVDIERFNNRLFIGTETHMSYLDDSEAKIYENFNSDIWDFSIFKRDKKDCFLHLASSTGLYELDLSFNLRRLSPISALSSCQLNEDVVAFGAISGIYLYQYSTKTVLTLHRTDDSVTSLYVDRAGAVWFATETKGAGFITIDGDIYLFNTSTGAETNKHISVYGVNGEGILTTSSGLYRFQRETKQWIRDCRFGDFLCSGNVGVKVISEDENSNVWTSTYGDGSNKVSLNWLNEDNSYYRDTLFFKRLPDMDMKVFYPESNTVWFGCDDGLYKYEMMAPNKALSNYSALIRKVTADKDSILYLGANSNWADCDDSKNHTFWNTNKDGIDFKYNTFTFEFAAPYFIGNEEIQYSTYLDGFDSNWSDWSTDTKCTYTNLREGTYTFHVKCRNVYGIEGEVACYSFAIRPPWYRCPWAYVLYVMGFLGIMFASVKYFAMRTMRQKKILELIVERRTVELVSQKNRIDFQRKQLERAMNEVTSSLKYARRIQDAILPSEEDYKQIIPDSFIYYAPKDIVSGDFYWVEKKSGFKIFGAIDCTGHGVPGAILAVVGYNLLNQAFFEKGYITAAQILKHAEAGIHKQLRQYADLDTPKYGMEASLCAFHEESRTLCFAGVRNSAYIISDGELTELKAERPIRKHDSGDTPLDVEGTQIVLKPNSIVYLFSDGFADQFGGEKGKKYKHAQFRQFLISISHLPMDVQYYKVREEFLDWMGDLDQVDDVVVMGVRL